MEFFGLTMVWLAWPQSVPVPSGVKEPEAASWLNWAYPQPALPANREESLFMRTPSSDEGEDDVDIAARRVSAPCPSLRPGHHRRPGSSRRWCNAPST